MRNWCDDVGAALKAMGFGLIVLSPCLLWFAEEWTANRCLALAGAGVLIYAIGHFCAKWKGLAERYRM